jgi:subtilisin family serine protease
MVLFVATLAAGTGTASAQTPIESNPVRLAPLGVIVKYRSEGPNALDRCAEQLSRTAETFSTATRDGSDSLDRLQRKFDLGPHRALMGGSDRESLMSRRVRLTQRFEKILRSAGGLAQHHRRPPQPSASSKSLSDLAHVYLIEMSDGRSAAEVAAALTADPHVEYAQPDNRHSLDQTLFFDDPFLTSSGSWGQPYADLWGPERIGAPLVWPRTQGEDVVVAVVDSGLDRFHPDMVENVWVNPGEDLDGDGRAEPEDENGIDDDGNGFIDDLTGFDFANSVDADDDGFYDGPDDVSDADPFDDRGHGTHVAGTIAAVAGNGLGIVGIAPRAKIMALKGFAAEGPSPDSLLWRAVLYAAENGADVINNSWSCGTPCPQNPLAEEVLEIVEALGTVVVTSAGNASEDVLFRSPENGQHAITVGSIGFDDTISGFSNTGWLVDVVGPGGGPNSPPSVFVPRRNILSLMSSGTNENERAFSVGEDYLRLGGTSMSAPHVTGAVALLLSLRPELGPAQVRRLIRMSARDLGEVGRDPIFGSGLLDVAALVDEPLPDLEFAIEAPRPGATHDPADGDLVLRGRAEGSAVVSIEIEIGAGLTARVFRPVESFGDSVVEWRNGDFEPGPGRTEGPEGPEGPVLARWDVSAVSDGSYTIRVSAHLADGRIAQEITIVGIERNQPFLISAGAEEAEAPTISGRRVFWHQDEPAEGVFAHDIFSSRFPTARELKEGNVPAAVSVFEGEGDQRNVKAARRELVWFSITEDGKRLERCRWVAKNKECDVEVVAEGEGAPSQAWIGGGWLVWMSTGNREITLEGCRIGRKESTCVPHPLLDPAIEPGWLIKSFDGETLLLRKRAVFALCRIEPTTERCTPDPFEFVSSTFAEPFDPIHHGDLIAFRQAGNRFVFPPGCEPGVFSEECVPTLVFSLRYHACWLDRSSRLCDEIPVSDFVPFDQAQGVAVSGRRIVWSTGRKHERAAIHFCEFDREGRECVDQRLTGHPAGTRHPAIDGARVVWEDARLGPQAIWGFELPSLYLPDRWRVRAGKRFTIPVFGWSGSSGRLRYEVLSIEGDLIEELDLTFEPFGFDRDSGRDWGRLVGRLPEDLSGQARWRIRAITNGGLFTEQKVELEIVPVVKPERIRQVSE